jgi:8-oxo-dGTP pyrophosphatase MutT (NUDIX family)
MTRARAKLETSAGGVVYRLASRTDGDETPRPVFLLIRDSYDNWGFPKGHLEVGEAPEAAARREVEEETGLAGLVVRAPIETIDWYFRFRGRLIHKVCHFYLMETAHADTSPQRSEGITACRWETYDDAARLISYANARQVLQRASELVASVALPPSR